jgi:hypothetical protein
MPELTQASFSALVLGVLKFQHPPSREIRMKDWVNDGTTAIAILAVASQSIRPIVERFGEGRGGGCLCIADDVNGVPVAKAFIGNPDILQRGEYWELAEEKVRRLSGHPEHISSWESRDTLNKRYGGAIRTSGGILGFSGLPEKVDEAFCIGLALLRELLSGNEALGIISVNENQDAQLVYETMRSSAGG